MAEEAIALVVVGSGDTTQEEIDDLLNDKYGDADADVGLIIPADKDLFTKTVSNVVAWYNDDDSVIPVQTKGASMTRGSSALGGDQGTAEVDNFVDILDPKEVEDFDEVHVLIALPEDQDSPEVDWLVNVVEVAQGHGYKVLDLTKGLDDIRIEEEEEPPAPEPEPEPEKPARRSRAKKAEVVTPEDDPDLPGLQGQLAEAKADLDAKSDVDRDAAPPQEFDPWNIFGLVVGYLEAQDQANAFVNMQKVRFRPLTVAARKAWDSLPSPTAKAPSEPETAQEEASEPEPEAPKRGRGRPRKNFEEKEVYDEDTEKWVKRPPGRVAKGTKHRTVNTDTGEVTEEGVV